MKTILLFIFFMLSTTMIKSQAAGGAPAVVGPVVSAVSTTDLNRVTFGFGAGYGHTFSSIYDYSLSTDSIPSLKKQKLSRDNFVISSVISVKLGDIDVGDDHKLKGTSGSNANLLERLSVNVALNLVEMNAQSISFNKSIDGGIGLGCYINSFTQVAAFFDIMRSRQIRDYVSDNYTDKPIPNGKDIYNALDESNNNLFYTKNIPGVSFKVVFSLGNKVD